MTKIDSFFSPLYIGNFANFYYDKYTCSMGVKVESRSFPSAEIQHFRTEITWSDYNWRILMWFTGINYY